jgi:hypothetical protein
MQIRLSPTQTRQNLALITSGRRPELFGEVDRINTVFRQFQMPGAPEQHEPKAHRIAVLARQDDFEAVMLVGLGFSNEVIRRRTGLTPGQIYARAKRAGVSRGAYRNGTSAFALAVLERVSTQAAHLVEKQYRYIEAHANAA